MSSQVFHNITSHIHLHCQSSFFPLLVQGCSLENRAIPCCPTAGSVTLASNREAGSWYSTPASSPWIGSLQGALFYKGSSACGSGLWCSKLGHISGTPAANLLIKRASHFSTYVWVILDILNAWFIVKICSGMVKTFWCCFHNLLMNCPSSPVVSRWLLEHGIFFSSDTSVVMIKNPKQMCGYKQLCPYVCMVLIDWRNCPKILVISLFL